MNKSTFSIRPSVITDRRDTVNTDIRRQEVNSRSRGGIKTDTASLPALLGLSSPGEYLAFHKVNRVFMSLSEMMRENPDLIDIYEFQGENFQKVTVE